MAGVRADARGRRARRRAAACALLAAVLVPLAACGAPEYTYVTNSDSRTYLKVPASWRQIEPAALDGALGQDPSLSSAERGFWLAGYDADPTPSPDHLLGSDTSAPAAFIGVRDIPEQLRGQVSLDIMRDLFRPVSSSAREQEASDPTSSLSGFALLTDEVLTPGDGLRGVHVVYKYRIGGGPLQVFDQTVYANDDASKLYMFYVRCSDACYEQRQREITNVVSSFTVLEKP